MQSLTSCQCSVCHDCFRIHFIIAVRDKHIRDMVCPVCSEPDINDPEQLDSYFSTLDIQVGQQRPETSSSSSSQRFTSEGFNSSKLDLERPCSLLMQCYTAAFHQGEALLFSSHFQLPKAC